jgi:phage shock protein A
MKRLLNLIRGFFALFIGGIEKNNPEALLENEKENLRKQIANFNGGLAIQAALVEKLSAQAKKLSVDEDDLRAKIPVLLQAGKRDLAAQLALRLQTVDKEHDEVLAQLEAAEKSYKDLTRARDVSVKAAKDKMEALGRGINDLKVKKATAELTEMANGMITSLGSSGDSLERITTLVEDERNKAAGRLRVAKDSVSFAEIDELEATNQTMAELALAQFEGKSNAGNLAYNPINSFDNVIETTATVVR